MNPAKSKTIKAILNRKINDWTSTLPDDLAKEVKKHIVVTGGCIVSLLRGEPVNDFDIYFDNIETAKKLAQHYIDRFDKAGVTICIEDELNIKGEEETRLILYVRSAGVAGDNPDEVNEADEYLPTGEEENAPRIPYEPVFISRNAITLRNGIQIITRFHGTPDEIHRYFDFVHATNYFYKNKLVLRPDALEHILSNTLIYRGSLYPIASIFRAHKFIKRGWRISAGEWLKIMWQISEVDMTDHKILTDQLTGVDAAYMQALIDALGNAEGKIDSEYVATIIDRIFNT